MGNELDDLPYWVALHSIEAMGPTTFRRLMEHFGGVEEAVRNTSEKSLARVARLDPALARGVLAAKERLDWATRVIADQESRGVRVVRIGDAAYPPPLKDIHDAPPLLYMIGEWRPQDARAVAIVGTTKPSKRGREIALSFARRFARAGCTVVSGYAHGCDSAGHRGALAAGGRTVFAIPTGIDLFESRWGYPPVSALRKRGAVVSESPPGSAWSATAAILRNRIIVALSRAVFIIETRPKGGTMNTFHLALKQQKPVFVLRYRQPPPSARGNEVAIARGAEPITTYREIETMLRVMEDADHAQ